MKGLKINVKGVCFVNIHVHVYMFTYMYVTKGISITYLIILYKWSQILNNVGMIKLLKKERGDFNYQSVL